MVTVKKVLSATLDKDTQFIFQKSLTSKRFEISYTSWKLPSHLLLRTTNFLPVGEYKSLQLPFQFFQSFASYTSSTNTVVQGSLLHPQSEPFSVGYRCETTDRKTRLSLHYIVKIIYGTSPLRCSVWTVKLQVYWSKHCLMLHRGNY